jgi:hypothetical protein
MEKKAIFKFIRKKIHIKNHRESAVVLQRKTATILISNSDVVYKQKNQSYFSNEMLITAQGKNGISSFIWQISRFSQLLGPGDT